MFTYFKNDSVRKLVIAVGTLFNNIKIMRYKQNGTTQEFTVPLTYAPKEKYIKRLTQPSSISDRTRVQFMVPQLAFELTDIIYDPARKLNKMFDKYGSTGGISYSSKMEVPYNFIFNLYSYTRNINENLEIMEQILPYFTPEFIVSINVTDLHKKIDVPIVLNKTVLTEEYEGDFSARRMVVSTYQFTAKHYVYNRIKPATNITREFNLDLSETLNGITYDII